jgi:hypothetical protein
MEYILENKSQYENFISGQTVEEYVENKKKDGIWGDSLEMSVFSQIFQINLLIYFYDDFPSNILKPQSMDNNELFEWRKKIYLKCIELNPALEARMIEVENYRLVNNLNLSFSLLYKNGNHYDALFLMSNQEYKETITKLLKNVFIKKVFNQKSTNENDLVRIQSQFEKFQQIRTSLQQIKEKELKQTESKIIQEMKPDEIKEGMETYLQQIREFSENHLEKDFKKQMQLTEKESYNQQVENQIMNQVMKESMQNTPQVDYLILFIAKIIYRLINLRNYLK